MNKYDLSGKVAIVTGGAQGFGLAITKKFLDSGAEVIIWDIDKAETQKVVDQNKDKKISFNILDITKFEDVQNHVNEISNKKKIDILINNAGITGKNATVWDYPVDEWKKVMDINLLGTFYCCKAIVPIMIKNNYGRIVNVASISGKEGNANAGAYSSAKAGVIGLTKSLGKELADKNIAVNAITPTTANTRILKQMTEKHVNFMLSKVPRNRYLELDELASMVAWLSSEENSFSTGAIFDISGGRATY
jgi:3-oxoacyl-[acyl-carrier protein] reductase|tara:strand:+ start:1427 stop:2173 length:747 start_codon:yes stop_codon:yes gene_type:complete